jgi:hypothetical protein
MSTKIIVEPAGMHPGRQKNALAFQEHPRSIPGAFQEPAGKIN